MRNRDENIHAFPSDLTFHDLIRQNKRNTVWLILGMGALTVAVGVAIACAVMIYGTGVISWPGIILAVVASLIVITLGTTWSYFAGGKTLLRIAGAEHLEKAQDPELFNVVEELSIAAGVPMPAVYVIDSPALNAFATGRDPEHASVAITRGLREKLTRDELQGVMAHEMAHVRHYDIRMTMMVATLVGMIVLACDVFLRMAFYSSIAGGRRRRSSSDGDRGGGGGAAIAIIMVIALLLAIVAPLLAKLIQLAVSRQREYLADAGAVELTRYPKGLADAPAQAFRRSHAAGTGQPRHGSHVHHQPGAERQGQSRTQLAVQHASARQGTHRPAGNADAVIGWLLI